jgi:hypothetical protein
LYNEKVQFQDCNSMILASFNTFTFVVSISNNKSISGDGFASLLWLTILIPLNLMMELTVLVVHQLAFYKGEQMDMLAITSLELRLIHFNYSY